MHSITVIGNLESETHDLGDGDSTSWYFIKDNEFTFFWRRDSGFIIGQDVEYVKVVGTIESISDYTNAIVIVPEVIEKLDPPED